MKPKFNQLQPGEIIVGTDQFQADDKQWFGVEKHLQTAIGQVVGYHVKFRRQVKFKKVSKSDQ